MQMRQLGDSGLTVSSLAYGALTFGRREPYGVVDVDEASAIVDRCFEAGVNVFDTADAYSEGTSEEVLGAALGKKRDQAVVVTKFGGPTGPGPNDSFASRRHIIDACEGSLRRLGTDYIDVYLLHNIDEVTPAEETLGALNDLIRGGKVRYIGCSNYSAWHVMRSLAASEKRGFERFIVLQANYSLLGREVEYEHIPLGLDQGVGLMAWGAMAEGFLSGRQRAGQEPPAGSRRAVTPGIPIDLEHGYRVLAVMDEIAAERGLTLTQIALNWVQARRGVSSVLFGARTLAQLDDNLRAATSELTPDEMQRLDAVSSRPVPYPYWHQRESGAARFR